MDGLRGQLSIREKFIIRYLGLQPWIPVCIAMHNFTKNRIDFTLDELWLVEHWPIFTQGKSEQDQKIIPHCDIPVMQGDRGGKITYHGPGQLVMYVMINLKNRIISVRNLVSRIEKSVIETLKLFNIHAHLRQNAPGVYITDKKICSIGLRIYQGCSLYGFSVNISMDLTPFQHINPCGEYDLEMTQLSSFNPNVSLLEFQQVLVNKFLSYFTTVFEKFSPLSKS
ncbi:MAG: lipoyl(octanoyl) transferase LipB [Candidatus Dasytiphilus stammeri]